MTTRKGTHATRGVFPRERHAWYCDDCGRAHTPDDTDTDVFALLGTRDALYRPVRGAQDLYVTGRARRVHGRSERPALWYARHDCKQHPGPGVLYAVAHTTPIRARDVERKRDGVPSVALDACEHCGATLDAHTPTHPCEGFKAQRGARIRRGSTRTYQTRDGARAYVTLRANVHTYGYLRAACALEGAC